MAAISLVASTLAVLAPTSASAATPNSTCGGWAATIVSAAATVTGTPGNDVIVATGTAGQTIRSGSGNDIICGSAGPDRIVAGDGNDTVIAGNGNDVVDAGIGNDSVDAGLGRDTVVGGAGDDVVTAGAGNDRVTGDAGNDRITGNDGSDTLIGGVGNDVLDGGSSPDVIDPGTGSNSCGSDTADSMRGPCAIDTTGPAISAITAPKVVTAGTTMTFTWRVVDTGGVGNTNVRIGGYSGWVTTWCGFVVVADLVGGSAFDGTYQVKCDVPANAVNGTYTLFLMASDTFANASGWDASSQFDFSVSDGSTDALPPAVSDLSARVDGDSVVVRWQASDPSGVAGQSAWLAYNVYSFASIEGPYFVYNAAALVEGDATNGVYEQRIDRRQITPSGTFTVWLTVIDTLGNKSFDRTATTFVL
ncbi:RTX calcium-binding nonapeptide repeat [Acidimicrobiia bacterium]